MEKGIEETGGIMERRRSLKKDDKDWKQFRFGRDRHLGISVSNEYYQPVPMFYTREGANVPMIGHYRGGSIFIVCNGPSLASGDYDLSLLKKPGVMTYGMNNGAKTIRPNFWTCVDDPKRFLKSIWLDPTITKFVPHAHAEKKIFDNEKWEDTNMLVGQCPNVVYYHRNEKFMADRFLFEDTINWGNSGDNGGGRSVMLPVLRICFLLGFRNVYLLGADFKMSQDYTYHFDEQRAKGAVNCNNNTYDKLKSEYLPALKPVFDEVGFNVFNCNPESELKVFNHIPFEQAIHNATSHLGDVEGERTWGMYSKPAERAKWKEEPDDSQKVHLNRLKNLKVPVSDLAKPAFQGIPMSQVESRPVPQMAPQPVARPMAQPVARPMAQPTTQMAQPTTQPMSQMAYAGEHPLLSNPNSDGVVSKVVSEVVPEAESRKIIRPVPCGKVCTGSSSIPAKPTNTKSITIEDDGN